MSAAVTPPGAARRRAARDTRAAAAAFRVQLLLIRRSVGDLRVLFTVPLYALIFLSIAAVSGDHSLTAYAVLAPGLISLWSMMLFAAGDLIGQDRSAGRLEAVVATPVPLFTVVAARLSAVAAVSLLSLAESWAVARWVFDAHVTVVHPLAFCASLLVTAFAMTGTATAMACAFVLSRSARIFQNSLSYPVYLLGGVLTPVSTLPQWLRPASRLVFLTWSGGLLRDSLAERAVSDPAGRLLAVLALGLVGFGAAAWLMRNVLARVRAAGTMGLA
ncbi:ABC transporter permease [Streptomyces sp. WP-1]|uniref:ABC transporter permease n=1 Tax=Streptomyces sp. WP-1 TaxID=3041497 RepID=UPI00264717CC|nr:ABC transporter permease [Streptomyces sp. WP-1]WKE68289.1 ABC transporter permease [Streptomyces sp. WP-1]